MTPNGFLATWGKQIVFVEGKRDILFFQTLLDTLGIDAIATQLTSKPSLKKLDSILREINDKWGIPLAIAVVDRDYYNMKDFSTYPHVECYSSISCDLEGLLLEPQYLINEMFEPLAKLELSKRGENLSSNPIKQLIDILLSDSDLQKRLFREYFEHSLRTHIGFSIRDKTLDINRLHDDAIDRLTDIVKKYIPTITPDTLLSSEGVLSVSEGA